MMSETQFGERGIYCMNEVCEEYQKIQPGHVIQYGQTDKGTQRYTCKICKKTCTETKGTLFYRLRHSEEDRVDCMAMLGDRKSVAAIHV
jgi:transposase-like protein